MFSLYTSILFFLWVAIQIVYILVHDQGGVLLWVMFLMIPYHIPLLIILLPVLLPAVIALYFVLLALMFLFQPMAPAGTGVGTFLSQALGSVFSFVTDVLGALLPSFLTSFFSWLPVQESLFMLTLMAIYLAVFSAFINLLEFWQEQLREW